jgi:hypothetical protein
MPFYSAEVPVLVEPPLPGLPPSLSLLRPPCKFPLHFLHSLADTRILYCSFCNSHRTYHHLQPKKDVPPSCAHALYFHFGWVFGSQTHHCTVCQNQGCSTSGCPELIVHMMHPDSFMPLACTVCDWTSWLHICPLHRPLCYRNPSGLSVGVNPAPYPFWLQHLHQSDIGQESTLHEVPLGTSFFKINFPGLLKGNTNSQGLPRKSQFPRTPWTLNVQGPRSKSGSGILATSCTRRYRTPTHVPPENIHPRSTLLRCWFYHGNVCQFRIVKLVS